MTTLDVALLAIRLVLGITFLFHGSQKLFGWFGGHGRAGLTGMMQQQGVALAPMMSWLATLSEFGGGLLVLVGLFTPFAAALIISTMGVAIMTVHFKNGFSNSNGGYEFNLTLIALALVLVLLGAGAASLDDALDINRVIEDRPLWSTIGVVLVSLGGVASFELLKQLGPKPTH